MADELFTGPTFREAVLMFADFKSEPLRLWMGVGPLVASGHEWRGSGELISVSEIDHASSSFAAAFTVTLSGLPEDAFDIYTNLFLYDASEYRLRRLILYRQFFDESWSQVGDPEVLRTGLMDKLRLSGRPDSRSISVQCETPFVTRRRPRYANYTDPDQQRRFPGDRGFQYAPAAAGKSLKLPVLPPT